MAMPDQRSDRIGRREMIASAGAGLGFVALATALGTALLGRKQGERIRVKLGGNDEEFSILKIVRYADTVTS